MAGIGSILISAFMAEATVLGMSWSFRSRNTGSPASATAA